MVVPIKLLEALSILMAKPGGSPPPATHRNLLSIELIAEE